MSDLKTTDISNWQNRVFALYRSEVLYKLEPGMLGIVEGIKGAQRKVVKNPILPKAQKESFTTYTEQLIEEIRRRPKRNKGQAPTPLKFALGFVAAIDRCQQGHTSYKMNDLKDFWNLESWVSENEPSFSMTEARQFPESFSGLILKSWPSNHQVDTEYFSEKAEKLKSHLQESIETRAASHPCNFENLLKLGEWSLDCSNHDFQIFKSFGLMDRNTDPKLLLNQFQNKAGLPQS